MRRALLAVLAALTVTRALLGAVPAQADPEDTVVLLLDRDGVLLRIDRPGAPPRLVTTLPEDPRGGTWWRVAATPGGDVVVVSDEGSLRRVDVATGEVTVLPSRLTGGAGIAVDHRGRLVLTDQMTSPGYTRVTRVEADGSGRLVLAHGLAHVVTEVLPRGRVLAVPIYDGSVRRINPGRGSSAVTPRLRGSVSDAHRTPDGGFVVATDRKLLRFTPEGTRTHLARGSFTGAAVAPDGAVVASFRFDLPGTRGVEESGGLLRVDPMTSEVGVEQVETFPEDVVVLGEASWPETPTARRSP